jgi:hypothetical protein
MKYHRQLTLLAYVPYFEPQVWMESLGLSTSWDDWPAVSLLGIWDSSSLYFQSYCEGHLLEPQANCKVLQTVSYQYSFQGAMGTHSPRPQGVYSLVDKNASVICCGTVHTARSYPWHNLIFAHNSVLLFTAPEVVKSCFFTVASSSLKLLAWPWPCQHSR